MLRSSPIRSPIAARSVARPTTTTSTVSRSSQASPPPHSWVLSSPRPARIGLSSALPTTQEAAGCITSWPPRTSTRCRDPLRWILTTPRITRVLRSSPSRTPPIREADSARRSPMCPICSATARKPLSSANRGPRSMARQATAACLCSSSRRCLRRSARTMSSRSRHSRNSRSPGPTAGMPRGSRSRTQVTSTGIRTPRQPASTTC